MKDIKTTPTVELVNLICEATDQRIINIIAYELACRVYVPGNSEKTFEELLAEFGYKHLENNNELHMGR